MRFPVGLSLAILGAATTFARGFALSPRGTNNLSARLRKDTVSLKPMRSTPVSRDKFGFVHIIQRGGGAKSAAPPNVSQESKGSIVNTIASLYGAGGVVYILAKSIRRILPIALEPFKGTASPLSPFQLAIYISMCLWFAYVEGYKGFQLKFSPLVVARAQTLKPFNGSALHHVLLAPFYSMGLFHATKKRKIVSWSVSLGVGVIVAAVKRLPYPWRNIVDAGVIVGLSWGSLSIIIGWIQAVVMKKKSTIDPSLP